MKKTVYICGPMDGLPFRNRQAFFDAERELASEGWRVVSAVKIWAAFGTDLALATDPTLRAAASAACIAALGECGALYLLPGWDDSGIAFRELNAAIDNSMQILGVDHPKGVKVA